MTVAFRSASQNLQNAGGASVTVSKPAGLAVGDLMIAHIMSTDNGGAGAGSITRTGWVNIHEGSLTGDDANDVQSYAVLYKYADSSDVAASSFQFNTPDRDRTGGAIYAFSGAAGAPDIVVDAETSGTGSPSFTNSLSPSRSPSILLFLVSIIHTAENSVSVDNYAIANGTPTWTERADGSLNFWHALAGATAPWADTSATGNSSCSISSTYQEVAGIMLAILPPLDAEVTPAAIEVSSSVENVTLSYGAGLAPNAIELGSKVENVVVSKKDSPWSNSDKSAASSLTNEEKNLASLTNQPKNSTSVVNQDKS